MAAERPEDVDQEFNRIVGGLGPHWSGSMPAWPDPPDAVDPGAEPTGPDAGNRPPAEAEPAATEEHFAPPPPPPLPRLEPISALCWLLVLGAPVLLMVVTLAGWYVPRWLLGLIGLGFVGGVLTLVLRLDDRPRDTDNGAVV